MSSCNFVDADCGVGCDDLSAEQLENMKDCFYYACEAKDLPSMACYKLDEVHTDIVYSTGYHYGHQWYVTDNNFTKDDIASLYRKIAGIDPLELGELVYKKTCGILLYIAHKKQLRWTAGGWCGGLGYTVNEKDYLELLTPADIEFLKERT